MWDARFVQTVNYAGNAMKGQANLCPTDSGSHLWKQEGTNVLEHTAASWPPGGTVCDTQGMAQWVRDGDYWGERYSQYESNCAGVRNYWFPSMDHDHLRTTGTNFKWKSRGTDNKWTSIGSVYR
jgi:hypothetical protein